MKRTLGLIGIMAACLLLSVTTAMAVPIIDFEQVGPAGGALFVSSPSGGFVSGTDIPMLVMKTESAVYAADAYLSFDTSDNYIWIFGSIPDLGVFNDYLLQGSFTTSSYTRSGSTLVFYGEGLDTKSSNLLIALGINPSANWEFFGFTLSGNINADGYGSAISTDILNTAVPEPGTMLLLGSGLVGLGVMRRRKVTRK